MSVCTPALSALCRRRSRPPPGETQQGVKDTVSSAGGDPPHPQHGNSIRETDTVTCRGSGSPRVFSEQAAPQPGPGTSPEPQPTGAQRPVRTGRGRPTGGEPRPPASGNKSQRLLSSRGAPGGRISHPFTDGAPTRQARKPGQENRETEAELKGQAVYSQLVNRKILSSVTRDTCSGTQTVCSNQCHCAHHAGQEKLGIEPPPGPSARTDAYSTGTLP